MCITKEEELHRCNSFEGRCDGVPLNFTGVTPLKEGVTVYP
jgi:hypothetical protein